jgi:hypothetical protein
MAEVNLMVYLEFHFPVCSYDNYYKNDYKGDKVTAEYWNLLNGEFRRPYRLNMSRERVTIDGF